MIEIKGQGQNGRIGEPLEPLQVRVTDENGEPRAFLCAQFVIVEGAGRFDFLDEKTDIQGNALAEFVPEGLGPYRIECRLDGGKLETAVFAGQIAADPVKAPAPPEPAKAPDCCAKRGCLNGKAAPCGKCPSAAAAKPATATDAVPSLDELVRLHGQTRPPKPAEPDWSSLGIPAGMVEEHAEAAAQSFTLTDPPPDLSERCVRSLADQRPAPADVQADATDRIPRSRSRIWLAAGMILGILALTGLLIASLAKANEPPVTTRPITTIDCSGLRPKIVGSSFVYENCAVNR